MAWTGEVRATRLGARIYEEVVDFRNDPRGREYLWLGGPACATSATPGTDTDAYDDGAASVTPLVLDLTATRRAHAGRVARHAHRRPEEHDRWPPRRRRPQKTDAEEARRRAKRPLAPPRRPAPPIARPVSSFDYCRSLIRDVPDFPKPGIVFKDITPLLASPRALHIVLDGIAERFIGEHVDAIVGIEARGFIFGGALAARLNASFVPVRKPGKLPASVDRVELVTEYSRDALEMHKGSIREGAHVVVVDDVLATGGTARAAAELVHRQGGYVVGYAFVVELVVPRRARAAAPRARRELPRLLTAVAREQSAHEPEERTDAGEESRACRSARRPSRERGSGARACTGTTTARCAPRLRSTQDEARARERVERERRARDAPAGLAVAAPRRVRQGAGEPVVVDGHDARRAASCESVSPRLRFFVHTLAVSP